MKIFHVGRILAVLLGYYSSGINAIEEETKLLVSSIGANHGLVQGRHGLFLFNAVDTYVGQSLHLYGEWCEPELTLFSKFVGKGQTVLDVGANVGAFTVPLAKMVGPDGHVHSFESQRVLSQITAANVVLNELHHVTVHNAAVGNDTKELDVPLIVYDQPANYGSVSVHPEETNWKDVGVVEKVRQVRLDDLFYVEGGICPSFIKIDVEGMELMALQGGQKLLRECQPILYIENNCVKDSPGILKFIHEDLKGAYVCHWDVHPYFNPNNFAGLSESVFSNNAYAINTLCYPKDTDVFAVEELQPMTKIDMEGQKFMLSQYSLSFIGREDIILGQLGTANKCVR